MGYQKQNRTNARRQVGTENIDALGRFFRQPVLSSFTRMRGRVSMAALQVCPALGTVLGMLRTTRIISPLPSPLQKISRTVFSVVLTKHTRPEKRLAERQAPKRAPCLRLENRGSLKMGIDDPERPATFWETGMPMWQVATQSISFPPLTTPFDLTKASPRSFPSRWSGERRATARGGRQGRGRRPRCFPSGVRRQSSGRGPRKSRSVRPPRCRAARRA